MPAGYIQVRVPIDMARLEAAVKSGRKQADIAVEFGFSRRTLYTICKQQGWKPAFRGRPVNPASVRQQDIAARRHYAKLRYKVGWSREAALSAVGLSVTA